MKLPKGIAMKHCHFMLALLLLASFEATAAASAGDNEAIMAVLHQYIAYEESGNMIEQGKLMTDDRSMVYVGGRLTGDNRKLMQEQQAEEDQHAKAFPGVHYRIEIKDVRIQTYNADAALVTLDWYPTRVVPPALSAETVKKLEAAKSPLIVALMLIKQQDAWKIAFSTFVPREKPKGT